MLVTKKDYDADDSDLAVIVDDGNDLLIDCAGGCKKKILSFGTKKKGKRKNDLEGHFCIDCLSKKL